MEKNTKEQPIYSHNPYVSQDFPFLVLDVKEQRCQPFNEGFRVLHWHEEIQFLRLFQGTLQVQIYEEYLELKEGDCLFINQNVMHQILQKTPCRYHSFLIPEKMLCYFEGSRMEKKNVKPVLKNQQFTHLKIAKEQEEYREVQERLRRLDEVYFEGDREAFVWEYQVSEAVIRLWLSFLAFVPQKARGEGERIVQHQRIQLLLSYIHANYRSHLSLKEIAESAHISQTECLRCFAKYVDCSPYQYLIQFRLKAGEALLKNTEMSVTEIALHIGFSSASSFIQYFKKYYQETPYRYRKKDLKEKPRCRS